MIKFYISTDWSDGVPRPVGCFTTDEGKRLDRESLDKMGRLFLAAPKLLAALKEAVALCNNFTPFGGLAAKWQDLIETAEGRDE